MLSDLLQWLADTTRQPGSPVVRDIEVDGESLRLDLSRQVLSLDIPERLGPEREAPSLGGELRSGALVSASMLGHKAKQVDDGIRAAVDLAVQNGLGPLPGKAELLRRLLALAEAQRGSEVHDVLQDAATHGGLLAVEERAVPEADLPPLGFYTWSEALERLFRQDRTLGRALTKPDEAVALATALRADSELRALYEQHLALRNALANPPRADASSLLEAGSWWRFGRDGLFVWPPSRSHENALARAHGAKAPPDYDPMDELIARVRTGTLSLDPAADSGWYDLTQWSLEPLITQARLPEDRATRLTGRYPKLREEVFRALCSGVRETHVKDLETGVLATGLPSRPRGVVVRPALTVEPLPTLYLRRALGYAHLERTLRRTFGEAVATLRRQTPEGPSEQPVLDALRETAGLLRGAAAVSASELGIAPETWEAFERRQQQMAGLSGEVAIGAGEGLAADRERFEQWASRLDDPDLLADPRHMVPLYRDPSRRQWRVWVVLGWQRHPLHVDFERTPTVQRLEQAGERGAASELEIAFQSQTFDLWTLRTASAWVSSLSDRPTFRAHCDGYEDLRGALEGL